MTGSEHSDAARVDAEIDALAQGAFGFLERLVGEASTVGEEAGAQAVVAAELERLGFTVDLLEVPESIAGDPLAGVPQRPYAGRPVVVGRLVGGTGRTLLVNGHVDVVPAGTPEQWSSPPFVPTRREGWLYGRGAGDMKCGFAMVLLAVEALQRAEPAALGGSLTFVSAIEEECTGNGTLASVRAGVLADAVLLPEPTDLQLLTAGVGVLWLDVEVTGRAGHALAAPDGVSALESAWTVVSALQEIAAELNAGQDPPRYHTNIGTFEAGEWRSTVPDTAVLGVRVGFPADWDPAEAQRWVTERLAHTLAGHPWVSEHPPRVTPSGLRAHGYALDDGSELARMLEAAHDAVHGEVPATVATDGTTDARFYLNEGGVPALCYGPRTRGMHGVDEAVELASIVAGARVLARFMAAWLDLPKAEAA
jgi:acetylornithine deacetylase